MLDAACLDVVAGCNLWGCEGSAAGLSRAVCASTAWPCIVIAIVRRAGVSGRLGAECNGAAVTLKVNDNTFTIAKKSSGEKITKLAVDRRTIDDYYLTQDDLTKGKERKITTE